MKILSKLSPYIANTNKQCYNVKNVSPSQETANEKTEVNYGKPARNRMERI